MSTSQRLSEDINNLLSNDVEMAKQTQEDFTKQEEIQTTHAKVRDDSKEIQTYDSLIEELDKYIFREQHQLKEFVVKNSEIYITDLFQLLTNQTNKLEKFILDNVKFIETIEDMQDGGLKERSYFIQSIMIAINDSATHNYLHNLQELKINIVNNLNGNNEELTKEQLYEEMSYQYYRRQFLGINLTQKLKNNFQNQQTQELQRGTLNQWKNQEKQVYNKNMGWKIFQRKQQDDIGCHFQRYYVSNYTKFLNTYYRIFPVRNDIYYREILYMFPIHEFIHNYICMLLFPIRVLIGVLIMLYHSRKAKKDKIKVKVQKKSYTNIENKGKELKLYKIYKHQEKLTHHEKKEDPYDFYIQVGLIFLTMSVVIIRILQIEFDILRHPDIENSFIDENLLFVGALLFVLVVVANITIDQAMSMNKPSQKIQSIDQILDISQNSNYHQFNVSKFFIELKEPLQEFYDSEDIFKKESNKEKCLIQNTIPSLDQNTSLEFLDQHGLYMDPTLFQMTQSDNGKKLYSCRHILYKYILSLKNQTNFNFKGKKLLYILQIFQAFFSACLWTNEMSAPLSLSQTLAFGTAFLLNWEEMFVAIKFKIRSLSRLSNMLSYEQIPKEGDKKNDQLQNWIFKNDLKNERNIPGINIFCANTIEQWYQCRKVVFNTNNYFFQLMDWKVLILGLTIISYFGIIIWVIVSQSYKKNGYEELFEKRNWEFYALVLGLFGKYVYEVVISMIMIIVIMIPKVFINERFVVDLDLLKQNMAFIKKIKISYDESQELSASYLDKEQILNQFSENEKDQEYQKILIQDIQELSAKDQLIKEALLYYSGKNNVKEWDDNKKIRKYKKTLLEQYQFVYDSLNEDRITKTEKFLGLITFDMTLVKSLAASMAIFVASTLGSQIAKAVN